MKTASSGARRRVGIVGLFCESNTFAPQKCGYRDFVRREGREIIDYYGKTSTPVGGMVQAWTESLQADFALIPILHFRAVSSGVVGSDDFHVLVDDLMKTIDAALPLDGLLLDLHGAMCAENASDVEGVLLRRIRSRFGPQLRLISTLDPHGNLTEAMTRNADLILPFHLFPHVDNVVAGRNAAIAMRDILSGALEPAMVFEKLPLITAAEPHWTSAAPMNRWLALAQAEVEAHPELFDLNILYVQPWLDVPTAGWSVLACSRRRDPEAMAIAQSCAARVAKVILDERHELKMRYWLPGEIEEVAVRENQFPAVISQSGDAPTGGSPGDNTVGAALILELGKRHKAAGVLMDAEAARRCHSLGVGAVFEGLVGAKLDTRFSQPIFLRGKIELLRKGGFTMAGKFRQGEVLDIGHAALIRTDDAYLILHEERTSYHDPGLYEAWSLDPHEFKFILVKSAVAFRSGFEGIMKSVYFVDSDGFTAPRLSRLPFSAENRVKLLEPDCSS